MSDSLIRRYRLGLAAALILITWGSLTGDAPPMPGHSDKLAHALAFLLLAGLADFAFPARRYDWRKVAPLLAYGLGIELAQTLLSHRVGSAADLLADATGLACYPLITPLLRKITPFRQRWTPIATKAS